MAGEKQDEGIFSAMSRPSRASAGSMRFTHAAYTENTGSFQVSTEKRLRPLTASTLPLFAAGTAEVPGAEGCPVLNWPYRSFHAP
jgi:NCAIR mutase (PurE)-related protein